MAHAADTNLVVGIAMHEEHGRVQLARYLYRYELGGWKLQSFCVAPAPRRRQELERDPSLFSDKTLAKFFTAIKMESTPGEASKNYLVGAPWRSKVF
jgi:hypothetical protein